MRIHAPAPHLARVGDTVASPLGQLRVVSISFIHPFAPGRPATHGSKHLPDGWLRRIDFVHTVTRTRHTTYLPEPTHPSLPCQAMFGHPAIGYTICGPLTTYEEAANMAMAEAMLYKRTIHLILDGIRVCQYSPTGEEQPCE